MKWKKQKASYTIEATIFIPLIFFSIMLSVKTGVLLHNRVQECAVQYENMKKVDAANKVRFIKYIE